MKPTTTSTNPRQLAWWAKDAVVYFIAAGSPPIAIKIGVTTWDTVPKRLAALQSSNHALLELLGVLPFRGMPNPMKAAEDRERELHKEFKALQCVAEGQRGHEWFMASAELLAAIESIAIKPEEFSFKRHARST
jgi:hypothetical protein